MVFYGIRGCSRGLGFGILGFRVGNFKVRA